MKPSTDGNRAEVVEHLQTKRGLLTLVARREEDWDDNEAWGLCIAADNGHNTHWTEWFETAEEAIQTGLAAIVEEGIDEFFETPGMPAFHEIEWTVTEQGKDTIEKYIALSKAGVDIFKHEKPTRH